MRVVISPEVDEYFENLVETLYIKGYFGYRASAREYVEGLIDDIHKTLPVRMHHAAPRHFDPQSEGMHYASFRKNPATTWYAFFLKYEVDGEIIYLVDRIENNHTAAQYM